MNTFRECFELKLRSYLLYGLVPAFCYERKYTQQQKYRNLQNVRFAGLSVA